MRRATSEDANLYARRAGLANSRPHSPPLEAHDSACPRTSRRVAPAAGRKGATVGHTNATFSRESTANWGAIPPVGRHLTTVCFLLNPTSHNPRHRGGEPWLPR